MAVEGGKSATATRKVMVIADASRESAAALQYTLSHAILENDSLILLHVSNNNNNRKHPFPFFKKSGSSINLNSQNNTASPMKEQNVGSDSARRSGSGSVSVKQQNVGSDSARRSGSGSVSVKEQNVGSDSARRSGSGSVDFTFLEEMKSACKKVQPQIVVTVEVVAMDGKDKASVILSQCSEYGIDLLVIGQRRTLSSAILGKQKRNAPIKGDTAEYLIENSKCTCVAVQKKGQNAGYLLNTKTHRDFWLLA